jgi:microcin C transport system substrate-binding protein
LARILKLSGYVLAALLGLAILSAASNAAEKKHGLSVYGALKYPADFKHFDYVNPLAPKDGKLRTMGTSAITTFDSFNMFIVKGDPAAGLGLLYDTLMTRAFDEPDAVYGLVALSAEVADDKHSVTFVMRPEARFRDGTQLTAEDVVFTFEKLRTTDALPQYSTMLRDVVKAEALDAHTVRYTFKGENLRHLPLMVAMLPILSKAYHQKVPFEKTTLEFPVGSGPYEIASYGQGNHVVYKRRPDYWGKDLPVNIGRYNFDEIRFEYFQDRTAGLAAFAAGDYDLREEFTSAVWAREYNFPAITNGKIKRVVLPDKRPSGAQFFFINTRRSKFADWRVRKALDLAFDFEWTNANLFYNSYDRTTSFFVNSDLEAKGPPTPAEVALLEPFRDKLPPQVFTAPPYTSPVSDGSGKDRKLLRQASKLLNDAGWTVNDAGKRVNAKGEPLNIEILMDEPSLAKVFDTYKKTLARLGIDLIIRNIDKAQYQRRRKSFDFDMDMSRFSMSLTPDPSIRNFFSSQAARRNASYNLSGISSPVVDALLDRMLQAKSREEMRTAAHALDRVLRAGYYCVPQWYKASHWLAFWDKFSWPATKPAYERGIIDTWWYDAEKAAKLK